MPPPTTPALSTRPLTLIVATTPFRIASTLDNNETRLGIGLKGTLPWPRIKTDMSFFARVTSRPPTAGTTNAIIMGRKTYESVPASLRPLGKRISVVITRDRTGAVKEGILRELEVRREKIAAKAAENPSAQGENEPQTDAIVEPSLDAALQRLEGYKGLGKVFVIGGAEIYGASLRLQSKRPVRIVMTNVVRKVDGVKVPFECDTFFPVERFEEKDGWRKASAEEVTGWVGEEVTGEWKCEGEVEVQMVGYEKVQ